MGNVFFVLSYFSFLRCRERVVWCLHVPAIRRMQWDYILLIIEINSQTYIAFIQPVMKTVYGARIPQVQVTRTAITRIFTNKQKTNIWKEDRCRVKIVLQVYMYLQQIIQLKCRRWNLSVNFHFSCIILFLCCAAAWTVPSIKCLSINLDKYIFTNSRLFTICVTNVFVGIQRSISRNKMYTRIAEWYLGNIDIFVSLVLRSAVDVGVLSLTSQPQLQI